MEGTAKDLGHAFVGRGAELEILTSALAEARAGRRRVVLLGGAPGIGKTRLTDEFAMRASADRATVLWGRCWEEGGAPAYWPWMQALRPLAIEDGSEQIMRWIDPVESPESGSLSTQTEEARFRLFGAISNLLARASAEKPLVVVLEDIHAADAPSLLLLRFVAADQQPSHFVVIATYRDTEITRHPLGSALTDLGRAPTASRLPVPGLVRDDVAQLVYALTGTAPDAALIDALHRETEGNPLFVGEVVRLLATKAITWDANEPQRWPIPEGVREAIGRRIARLPDECRATLRLGAVIGRDFGVDVLEHATGSPAVDVLDALRPASEANIITDAPGVPGKFRFTHALMREALYDELPSSERMRMHAEVGRALEDLVGSDEEHSAEIANHFYEAGAAGDTRKAADYAATAGARALSSLAYEEGARLYRMSLHAMRDSPDEGARCTLLLRLGEAERRSGDASAAKETYLQAAEIASRLDDAELIARAALGYAWGYVWVRAGIDRHVIPLLRQALNALPAEDSVLRALVLARLSGALRDQPSLEPRTSIAREAVEMARRLGDPSTLVYTLMGWWCSSYRPGAQDEYRAVADEVDALWGDTQSQIQFYSRWIRFVEGMATNEIWEAREQYPVFLRLSDELRQRSDRYWAYLMATLLALHDGRFADAEQQLDEGIAVAKGSEDWNAGASRLFALFAIRREQGRLEELEAEFRNASAEYPGYRSFRCMLLLTLCATGRLAEARGLFDQLSADLEGIAKDSEYLFILTLLSEAAIALGARDRMEEMYRLLIPYADLMGWASFEAPSGPVSRALGLLAAVLERYEEAERHLAEAIALAERGEAWPWIAHSQHDLAAMLVVRRRAEDRDRAVDLLASAAVIAEQLGMNALTVKISAVQARLGVRTAAKRVSAGGVLTPREREVAELVAEGLSNRDIAERLFVSERTAETHVQNILTKLGFSSRTQIAGWVVREDIGAGT